MKLNRTIWIIILTLFFTSIALHAEDKDVKKLIGSYIDALVAKDYKKAEEFWHPQYIETCCRLGINYRDVPNKYDCMSPLIENIESIRNGEADWSVVSTRVDPAHHKAILKMSMPDDTISCDYFFQDDTTGLYIVPRFWLHLNNLSLVSTKYFDVFYRNRSQLNDFALYDIDRFVDNVAAAFGVPEEKLKTLEKERMEYLLVESDNEVSELLGFRSRGVYFIPSDIIITRYLPDYHEIAHFMVNYTQDNLGLCIEPFMLRGLACMLGGRFGQRKEVMPQIAGFTLTNGIYSLEDVLTFDGFNHKIGNIDFSYPLSLGLVETLTDKFNITGTLTILSNLSGSVDEITGKSSDDVKAVITKVTGENWDKIEKLATDEICSDPFPNLKPGGSSDSGMVMFESGTQYFNVKITLNDGWYNVTVKSFSPDKRVEAAVTMSGSVGNEFSAYKSSLWKEQYPNMPYSSQIYSIRFNPDEAGVYDYLTNELVAKYVSTFDEMPRLTTENKIVFRFKENLLRARMDSYWCQIVRTKE